MSNTNETKTPTYRIYSVQGEGEKAVWHELGAAWAHKDGKGFNLQLKALPLPGAQMVLREPLPPQTKARTGMPGREDELNFASEGAVA